MRRSPVRPPLVATKVRAPLPIAAVPRPRLEAHATSLARVALTVVSAGAGFGKTTILRIWAERCAQWADVAWVGLDDGDADVRTFAAYLEAALQRAVPELGTSIGAVLESGAADAEPFARTIANELLTATEERERDVVVFLDDFHAVAEHRGVRELFAALLRALPPRAHFVVASRCPLDFSPIVRMRAERCVADFTQSDLRFTSEEALALLEGAGVDASDLPALEGLLHRTDGWPMALRLSVQATFGRTGGPLSFGAQSERSIFAYLADEVLRAQPVDVRGLLLDSAVLKTLEPGALERVLELPDGRISLDALIARNLYLEPTGERAYRYHNLFREFLIETLAREAPERLHELRLRYARYLEESGDVTGAVIQYMEAGDFISVADHVGQALAAIKYGENVDRIATVLTDIPETLKRERPRLLQFEATALRRRLDFAGAEAAYERARRYALEQGDFATACACTVERGMLADDLRAGGHGRFERSLAHFREALEYAERCGAKRDMYVKIASITLGLVHAARCEYDLAEPYLAEAERLQRSAATQRSDVITTIATIYGWQGEWHRALEYAELAEDLLRSGDADYLIGRALKMQAKAHCFLRDDLPQALAVAEAAIEAERAHNEFDDLPDAYVILSRAHLAQSVPAVERAHAALDEAASRLRHWPNRVTSFDVAAARFETYVLTGHLGDARRALAAARTWAEANDDPHESALVCFLEGLFAAARGEDATSAERFAEAYRRFVPLDDKFYVQLSDVAKHAARARLGSLRADELEAMLARCEAGSISALRSAPRSAAILRAWAVRHGVAAELADALLSEAARRATDDDVVAIALDESATQEARVRAIALLARERRVERRPILVRLGRDRNAAIAAAATTALNVFPRTDVARLTLHVVGPVRVAVGDQVLDERSARWTRRKAIEMLRALALADGPIAKSTLLAALWPESGTAAAETSLRVTLHALRRALEPDVEGAGNYIEYDGATLALRKESVASVDAELAQQAFRRASFARARKAFAEAESLFEQTIDLLSAVQAEEHAPPGLTAHVRGWRATLVAAMRAMAELRLAAGSAPAAQMYAERALMIEPLDEDAIRIALEVAFAAEDLDRAKRLFVAYKKRLADELSATPGPEVLAVYGKVLKARSERRNLFLTPRELQILTLIGRGRSNKQIATELGLSPWTINGHVGRILRKLGVESRAAAVASAGGLLEG